MHKPIGIDLIDSWRCQEGNEFRIYNDIAFDKNYRADISTIKPGWFNTIGCYETLAEAKAACVKFRNFVYNNEKYR